MLYLISYTEEHSKKEETGELNCSFSAQTKKTEGERFWVKYFVTHFVIAPERHCVHYVSSN